MTYSGDISTIGIAHFGAKRGYPATAIVKILNSKRPDSCKETMTTLSLQNLSRYIVQLYCFYQTTYNYVLFLEHCMGGTMHDRLTMGANWEEWRLLEWFRQLAEAVATMHTKRYAHRDIKPHNIFLTESDEIRLGDFGEASAVRESLTKYPRGTPNYIPNPLRADVRNPMQVSKECGYSHDIWSLGRTFYEMCMGRYVQEFEERKGDMRFCLQMVTYNLNAKGISSRLVKLITDMLSVEVIPMEMAQVVEAVARLIAAREPLRPVELTSEETLPLSFSSLKPPKVLRCQYGDQHPKDLQSLECGHTFCKACLEIKCAKQGRYICPLCPVPQDLLVFAT
jgi:serine/threonine protein kinase